MHVDRMSQKISLLVVDSEVLFPKKWKPRLRPAEMRSVSREGNFPHPGPLLQDPESECLLKACTCLTLVPALSKRGRTKTRVFVASVCVTAQMGKQLECICCRVDNHALLHPHRAALFSTRETPATNTHGNVGGSPRHDA